MNAIDELNFYNNVYSTSDEYRKNPVDSIYINLWMDLLEMTGKDESIFEIGCGSGQLAKLLIENGRRYVLGFDYSKEAIKIAKQMNPNHINLFFVKDVYTVKEIDCDTAICVQTLEHLDNDLFVFSLLKPGTRFIFSVPNFDSETHKRIYKDIGFIKDRYHFLKINTIKEYSVANKTVWLSKKEKNKIYLIDSTCR